MAPQFSPTKARALRGPLSWMARATSSLPLPDSPTTRTGTSEAVTRSTSLSMARMGALSPMMPA